MRRSLAILAAVFVLALVFAQYGEAAGAANFAPGQLIVKFKKGAPGKAIDALNAKHGAKVLSASRFAGFNVLSVPNGRTVAQMVNIYKGNPNVEYAEPNYIAHATAEATDPLYSYQWHLPAINVEPAWDVTIGAGVVVAVVDTGVAYEDHTDVYQRNKRRVVYTYYSQAPDLADTDFVAGYDFVNNDAHPNDDEGHGTHVTGTIAQSTNNGLGVAGIAYGCSIMPVKVLDAGGSGTYDDIADGIYFAADNGADVINMSLGGSVGSATLENAVAYAYNNGVTIVCASGNDGSATDVSYPAAYDAYCIAVGATRYDETVSYYSNGGASLDITAPGGDIYVDQNGDGYGDGVLQQTHDGSDCTVFGYYFYQGTSMAAPHVSGVAALVISAGAGSTPDEVRGALQATARDMGATGWDAAYGHGIVDAAAAVNYQTEPNNPPVADAGGPYTGTEDAAVAFDGSGSSDPDDDALTYSWDFGDGSNGSGVSPSHAYAAGGTYTVTLVVNDGKADSDSSITAAMIAEVNDAPVADAGSDQSAAPGEAVVLDGSGSYDVDDGIVSYDWDLGDGNPASGETVSHTYAAAGVYKVTLTVTDLGGLTDTDTAVITVEEQTVTVVHVSDIVVTLVKRGKNYAASATVTVVDEGGAAVGGVEVTGDWTLDGSALNTAVGVTDGSGATTLVSSNVKVKTGAEFVITVTDATGDGIDYQAGSVTSGSVTVP